MDAKEVEREFLSKVCDYLVSLPFDLKILQEAAATADLDRAAREVAAGAVMHAISPSQEGTGPERYFDDVLLVRVALGRVRERGGDGASSFCERFPEVYSTLSGDLELFEDALGPELWQWVSGKLVDSLSKLVWKGKRAAQYVEEEDALDDLYEDGLDFQTNYNVTEAQVKNKLRRLEQVTDFLRRSKRG